METTALKFNRPLGSFRNSIRAYKEYKREWEARMAEKLAQEEEEIRRKRESLYAEYE
ncbi:MAG: hypothetical protein IJ605_00830 [Prevotella sp.]|nr:hypothetical protein [Prevotella sp.]